MKTIVVSGINLFAGGPLKIMQDCLAALSRFAGNEYRIVALVHDEKLYPAYENVQYLAFPRSRKSWLFKIYYEYIGFRKLSTQLKPDCWLSLHDVTPNVKAGKRVTYCHNSLLFYRSGWRGFFLQRGIFLISFLSRYLYRINIRKNDYVVVQQQWMREALQQLYGIDRVVVSLPVHEVTAFEVFIPKSETTGLENKKHVFFYPSRAMIHKNFEIICQAASLLEKEGIQNMEVILTINGQENKYTRYLYKKYKSVKSLRFAGLLNREEMDVYYKRCDCVIFPSKTESWGLPLTEAMQYQKPIMASELSYARETIGKYELAKFFDPDNAIQLAGFMKAFLEQSLLYDPTVETEYKDLFTRNWEELFQLILKDNQNNQK